MDGVRRRLRDVSKTVSGVLGVRLGEGPEEQQVAQSEVPVAGEAVEPAGEAVPAPVSGPDPSTAPAPPVAPDESDGPAVDEPVPAEAVQPAVQEEPDGVLAQAVEQARAAAVEVGGAAVGEHLGVEVEASAELGPVLTHSFASTDKAYVGWRWAVTVARAEGSEHVTVDEVVLLPGDGALLALPWVPWSERVQPGDLSAGDLLPPPADDPRLVPAYADTSDELDEDVLEPVRRELGLGRPRVLSVEGRADAAERWYLGDAGPDTPVARQAPGRCADCGFLVLLAGGLRSTFGVCANAYAPDDGRVVALTHGCGAHSETLVDAAHAATTGMAVEHDELELVAVGAAEDAPADDS